jgi:4-alpha-glucanotransferase
MGFDADVSEPLPNAVGWVVRGGERTPIPSPAELTLENGNRLRVEQFLPLDVPVGYHELQLDGQALAEPLIVSPTVCSPPATRQWGWSVQLYAVRSAQSWGFGDFADLRRLARWSAELGAGFSMINPLGAAAPTLPQEPSPYRPTTRLFHNVCYLCIPEIAGAAEAADELAPLAAQGRALNQQDLIDRDAVFRLKMEALELLWPRQGESSALDRFCEEQGSALTAFATFCSLAEEFGGDWRCWPTEYRQPKSAAVRRFAAEHRERVRFHQWIQFLLDEQLAGAARELPLVRDLPVGFDPGGADAWMWQDTIAHGVSIGAPPDQFNADGQDWSLPPFVPHKLRAAGYQPFVETIRASLRHAVGLRIDHVMGLFRLYWIPDGFAPTDGAYVRYPADDLLAIVALESQQAGTWIAGEDLGTVEPDVRRQLAQHGILSTKVLWFEDRPPTEYPALAMSAVTTHDLPTIAGLWSGSDEAAQHRLGMRVDVEGYQKLRERLICMTGVSADAPVEEVIRRTHELLAQAPSAVLIANLTDALAIEQRPNMPGTVDQWPNWSLALPRLLEEIESETLPSAIAQHLSRSVRFGTK